MEDSIKKESKELVNLIFNQTHKLLDYEQDIPQIEIDIVKEKIRKLYDNLDGLIDTKVQTNSQIIDESIEESLDKQVTDLLNEADSLFEENIQQLNHQIEEQEEQKEKPVIQFHNSEKETIPTNEAKIETKQIPFEQTEIESLKVNNNIQLEQEPTPKQVSQVETPSIGDQLQNKTIKSLKSAIGINDKFQFINELFDGSMKSYNLFIDELELSSNGTEAIRVFKEISTKSQWDEENLAYIQLLEYVNRRFL